MIGMFMRNQHRIQLLDIFADRRQTRLNLLAAQAGVHEKAGSFGGNKRTIARTAAGENANFNYGNLQRGRGSRPVPALRAGRSPALLVG